MAPRDPNEIDINLSLLPGESELAINSLVAQMRAISAQLAVLQAPSSGAAAQAQLLAFQQTGMPTHGVSATASDASKPHFAAGTVAAAQRAKDAREQADRAEEARRAELERRREQKARMEEMRSQAQADRDAAALAREDQQRRQEEARQVLLREERGTARAEAQLEAAGPIRSMRYALTGRLDRKSQAAKRFNRSIPDGEAPYEDEEIEASFARTRPARGRPLRRLTNRVLQVSTPEAARLSHPELEARAQRRAAERLSATDASYDPGSPPPGVAGRGGRGGGPSVPPTVATGDDGYPDPNHPINSAPDHVDPSAPAWQRHVSEGFTSAPMTMPRIGEFTAQDTLTMISQFLGRRAYDRIENGGGGGTFGTTAAAFSRMANSAPYLANLRGNLGRRGFDISQDNFQRVAYLTGQDRPGTITQNIPGIGPVSVADPIAAARASVRGATTIGRMATAGTQGSYLRTGEAAALGGELITRGFSEEAATRALRGPLGHIRGEAYRQLEPGAIIDAWQKSLLAGGESMTQFTKSMSDLVPAARAARMNVDEFNASADQFAEQIQTMGGTYVGGRNAANTFALQTGMAPQVGAQMMNNELVQGLTFSNTGILPQLQGMLPQGVRTQQASGSLGMMVDLMKGAFQDQSIDVPGGQMTISGQDQAVAMAGQAFGLDREAAQRLYDQQDALKTMTPVNNAYDAYMQDVENARKRYGNNTPEFRRAVARINQGRGRSGVSRDDIAGAMDKAGLDGAAVASTQGTGIGDVISEQQRKRWGNIFDKQADSDAAPNVTVALELKGEAKELLRRVRANQPAAHAKRAKNSGDQNASDLFGALGGVVNDIKSWGG